MLRSPMPTTGTGHSPATRWARPPPWLAAASDPIAVGPPVRLEAGGREPAHRPGTEKALLALLEHDLRCGHKQVAIRHFCMLRALGAEIPQGMHRCCERLVLACAPVRLARIHDAVHQWLAMLS